MLSLIILTCVALLLLLVELFVAPGIGLAGLGALLCAVYVAFMAFELWGLTGGTLTLLVLLLLTGISVWAFMRSKMLKKIALNKRIDSTVEQDVSHLVHMGDKGKTLSRLAEVGQAEINGHIIEVHSMHNFIAPSTPVVVRRIDHGVVYVEAEE